MLCCVMLLGALRSARAHQEPCCTCSTRPGGTLPSPGTYKYHTTGCIAHRDPAIQHETSRHAPNSMLSLGITLYTHVYTRMSQCVPACASLLLQGGSLRGASGPFSGMVEPTLSRGYLLVAAVVSWGGQQQIGHFCHALSHLWSMQIQPFMSCMRA